MTLKPPLYAAIGDGFSGATDSKAEAEEWVRNNKSGVGPSLAELLRRESEPATGLTREGSTMAARQTKPDWETEIDESGGLKLNCFHEDGRVEVYLDLPAAPKEGICVGTGLSPKSALRDAKGFFQNAVRAIENSEEQ